MKKGIMLMLIAALCMLQTGCDKKLSLPNNTEKKTKYFVSKDISFPILDYRTLNPVISRDEDVYSMEKLIYQGLVKFDSTMEPQPCLAESWNYENNGMSIVFNLRDNVYWHDGKKFAADDVEFTINVLLKTRNTGISLFNIYTNNIKSVETLGEHAVRINFLTGSNNAVENFIFPIIPKHRFASINDVYDQSKNFFPIGTGPYMVSEIENNQYIKLIGFDKYYEKTPTNTITFKNVPTVDDAVNLLEINEINIAFVKNIDMEKYLENKALSIKTFPSNEPEVLGFNFANPVLANKKIRQAIAYSLNINDIINDAYYRSGVKSSNLYYPSYLGINQEPNPYGQDYNKAAALIKEAGFIDRNGDGILENEEGLKLQFNMLVNSENPARMEAARIIKNSLDKVQIKTTIMANDWSSYNTILNSGAYDLYIGGFSMTENFDFRFALHSAFSNPIRYSNINLDTLLDKMQSGITTDEKKQTFSEIKKILDEEIPYYCLLYKTYAAIMAKNVNGDIAPCFFNLFYGIEDLQLQFEQTEEKAEQ